MERIKQQRQLYYKKSIKMDVNEWRDMWGVENWTISDAYPRGLSRLHIKWEFTRRNAQYRGIWESYEEDRGKSKRGSTNDDEIQLASEASAAEFELKRLINPRKKAKDIQVSIFERRHRGMRIKESMGTKINSPNSINYMLRDARFSLCVFDLRFPLPEQMKRLAKEMERGQRALKAQPGIDVRSHDSISKDYTKHLRILDAFAENESTAADIGAKIFGVDENHASGRASKELQRALEMWRWY